CFVSDEETGSKHGLAHLLERDLFKSDDLIVITDAGNSEGTMLEVAEKSILWLKAKAKGKQAHASLPNKAVNALTSMSIFINSIHQEANNRFPLRNQIYDVPWSSFEPTKTEGGVGSTNTIPGEMVAYFDCRILPEYELEDVVEFFREKAKEVSAITGAEMEVEIIQSERAAPPTSPEAPVVRMLKNAVSKVHNNNPKPCGIGGGTVAALLRKNGFQVVAWGKIDDMAHAPNEYSRTKNLVNGAKVYALLALEK
ncbi:MAG: M20/M25/M40 family metallo-hydrolase, partial [Candidatus Thermoplasmatota archaeon]|nr:M20/M25/M40 family metallo-hydrolase [Candidatus Thermoplasmatota archaeon]